MAKKIYPGAEFEPCDNEALPFVFDLFAQISLLAPLPAKTRENLEKCPGAMRLRRFRQGEPICRQGEEDCTAFYILKIEDLEALKQYPHKRVQQVEAEIASTAAKLTELKAAAQTGGAVTAREIEKTNEKLLDLQRELAALPALGERVKSLPTAPSAAPTAESRKAALVQLARADDTPTGTWLQRLTRRLTGVAAPAQNRPTISIPFDGPTDISLRTRQAILNEGELFGEMACLNRSPRSATVSAARDCYILEMLSNILTEIDKDPGYQKERNRVYKERALDLQLRDLSIFRALTDREFAAVADEIRGTLELIAYKGGALICDEHERSDCVYLVRSGLVQVKRNVSSLLGLADVTSWATLGRLLRERAAHAASGERTPLTAYAALLHRLLPAETLAILERTENLDQAKPEERAEIVHGLNAVLKDRRLAADPACQEISTRARLHERVRNAMSFQKSRAVDRKELDEVIKSATLRESKEQAPAQVEAWSELDQRRLNRLLLEELLPGCLRPLPAASGPDAILTYCSRGDFIGEMGVWRQQPRSTTCIAFGQPRSPVLGPRDEDVVQVELVRIPGEVFLSLMERFPALRASVEAELPRRDQRDQQFSRTGASGAPFARESDRLGLIEGQRLMLIDMESCTMCGECVRGCVDAHADGRSRLFLVGPRFDKYMVPMTCRACLDPVCMIDCPVRSIQRGDNREIVIKDWCIGCQKCAKNCPYDAIKMHELPTPAEDGGAAFRIRNEIAVVCDLCSSLPDQTPRCVYACPHEAAMRIDAPVELQAFRARGVIP